MKKSKRLFLLICIMLPVAVSGQVVNFAKTLPQRAFSVGLSPAYYIDNNSIGLNSIGIEGDEGGGIVAGLTGGYGVNYSMDLGVKFLYVHGGRPFFGVDMQYLLYEARKSYFSVIGGFHRWDAFGADLTGLFTYSPRYEWNFSVGLDLDVDYLSQYDTSIRTRFWLPVNVGYNVNDMAFLYAEFDLQVSELSWGIVAVGANFIFR